MLNNLSLVGCWANTAFYEKKLFIDKIIEFIDEKTVVVYSYFDKGKNIYDYSIQNIEDQSMTILIQDDLKQPTVIKFVGENNIEFEAASNGDIINMTRLGQEDANKYIDILEQYAEY